VEGGRAQTRGGGALALVGLALAALGIAGAELAAWTPDPLADGDRRGFSAGRAIAATERLLGAEPAPRPVGSAALQRVQDELVDRFEDLGLAVDDRTFLSCSDRQAVCARVRNLRVRVPGRGNGPSILLATHSDGVEAGPAVADAGASLGILLEVARALLMEPSAGPVDLLVTDGEEADLLGARAFVEQDPAWSEVGAVVNLEARGTGGRSWMFEVTDDWLVRAYARAVPHPATTSVAAAVYRAMPVDTDLSVFRRERPGLGLAFIEGAARYHTPVDDFAHLDPGSVQQQGEAALALVRALSEALPQARRGSGALAWTDLFGRRTWVWPASLSLGLLAVGFLGALVALGRAGALATAQAALHLGLRLLFGVAAVAATALVLARAELLQGSFPPRLGPGAALLALAGALAVPLGDRGGATGARLGMTTALWALLGAVAHRVEPGASWVLAAPAAAGGLAGLLPRVAAGLLPVAVSSAVLPVFLLVLPEALGAPMLPVVGLFGLLWATWLLPLCGPGGGRPAAAVIGLCALAAGALLVRTPAFTADEPQGTAILVVGDAEGSRIVPVADGPDPVRAAMVAAGVSVPARGPPLFEPPVVEWQPAQGRLLLRSQRGAPALRLSLEEPARPVAVHLPGLGSARLGRGLRGPLTLLGMPPEGVEVEVVGALGAVTLTDRSPGLPASVDARWVDARGATAVPIHRGDGTEVVQTVQLGAPAPAPAPAPDFAPWEQPVAPGGAGP
jgi:hypothetical protein